MQAAGVLKEPLESGGHTGWPAGVEATPGASVAGAALVTQAAASPDPGHGWAPSGKLSCRPSPADTGQSTVLMACAHDALARCGTALARPAGAAARATKLTWLVMARKARAR